MGSSWHRVFAVRFKLFRAYTRTNLIEAQKTIKNWKSTQTFHISCKFRKFHKNSQHIWLINPWQIGFKFSKVNKAYMKSQPSNGTDELVAVQKNGWIGCRPEERMNLRPSRRTDELVAVQKYGWTGCRPEERMNWLQRKNLKSFWNTENSSQQNSSDQIRRGLVRRSPICPSNFKWEHVSSSLDVPSSVLLLRPRVAQPEKLAQQQ